LAEELFCFGPPSRQLAGPNAAAYARNRDKQERLGSIAIRRDLPMEASKSLFLLCVAALALCLNAQSRSQAATSGTLSQEQPSVSKKENSQSADQNGGPALPRGKKLVLKDGSFQLIREYKRDGDRVRYYSAERGDWEEIPAAMVDWDATKKADAADQAEEDAFAKKVGTREQAFEVKTVMDVDASLEVAPKVFLPPGEGMFVVSGHSVTPLLQAGTQLKTDKKQFLKQVLSPIPIVPGKQNLEIPGAKSKIRVNHGLTEFYLREAPPDPDRTTPIIRSSRPGESGPEVELIRAKVKGNMRVLESIKSMFGEEVDQKQDVISIQRWEVAPTVYRFTLSEDLPPGEYALAEMLTDGMNLFVWDFGVEPAANSPKK